jgi:hypothetical protein
VLDCHHRACPGDPRLVFFSGDEDVDGRVKPGHDEGKASDKQKTPERISAPAFLFDKHCGDSGLLRFRSQ